MKNYGIVTEYNGVCGNIKGIDSVDYKFSKEDLLEKNVDFNENNYVEFEIQKTVKPDFVFYRANYVKVLKKQK